MKLSTVGRVARNSIAVTLALLIKRLANFVLYLLVARYLGVLVFGQFSLIYTFYIVFQVPATFGLAALIVREVAKNKSVYDKYLINGHFVVLLACSVSWGLWALIVHLLGYSSEVIKASYLLGLALVPFAMTKLCEAIFQAFERMQFITYAFVVANLTMLGLAWLLLSKGFGLNTILCLLVIIQGIMLLIEWSFIYRYFPRPSWTIDFGFSGRLAKTASTFLGISVFTTVFLRLNIVVLSKVLGEIEVGLYNAAFQLTYVFMLISMSLQQAVYPVLSRTYTENLPRFKQYAERSVEFLLSLAFPLAVAFFFLAESILFLYKEEFIAAASVMRILGWMLIPLSFNRILGGVLLASGRQRLNLYITIANTISAFLLAMILIRQYGLFGAGLAALASHFLSFAFHYGYVTKKILTVSILRVSWKPIVASLLLASFLFLLGKDCRLLTVVPSGAVLYTVALLSLNYFFGGPMRSLNAGRLMRRSRSRFPEAGA